MKFEFKSLSTYGRRRHLTLTLSNHHSLIEEFDSMAEAVKYD